MQSNNLENGLFYARGAVFRGFLVRGPEHVKRQVYMSSARLAIMIIYLQFSRLLLSPLRGIL